MLATRELMIDPLLLNRGVVVRALAIKAHNKEIVYLLLEKEPVLRQTMLERDGAFISTSIWRCLILFSEVDNVPAGDIIEPTESFLAREGTLL